MRDSIYVLHAFQKKTQQTVKRDLDPAAMVEADYQREGDMTDEPIQTFDNLWDRRKPRTKPPE